MAATKDRSPEWQPSEQVAYVGSSGTFYKGTLVSRDGDGNIRPYTVAGGSHGNFLGVAANHVEASGNSNTYLRVYKVGEVTLSAQGTGSSTDIGQIAYGIDDETVGTSAAATALPVGEIVGLPSTSEYRVRIDNYVSTQVNNRGVSWDAVSNP
jgi:hypothetical protein